jgi:ABC-2 type transport system ATP-binding protein
VSRAAAEGAAVVFATTYVDEAERADRVLVLDEGRSLVAGTPDEVVAAIPGAVFDADRPPPDGEAWRHGSRWRVWSSDGVTPPGARRVSPDLQDAVAVAALAQSVRRDMAFQ